MWDELEKNGNDFQYEINKVFDNPAVKEADKGFTPDSYDNYVNMEVSLDRGSHRT